MKRTPAAPSSSYRLQLHLEQDLSAATALVDYLADLGVHWVYTSPLLTSRAGSLHGYDIVDPSRIDSELGSRDALNELTERLRVRDMGLLIDVVANHMGAYPSNPWWRDVLEAGEGSPFARYFDVDFPEGKLRLPVLGDDLEAVVGRGELSVERHGADLWLRYWERRFPLAVESWPLILEPAAERLDAEGAALLRRARQHQELGDLIRYRPGVGEAIDAAAKTVDLNAVLAAQHYRLGHFKDPASLSYRRFFDVSELVAVRVEDTEAFDARHAVIIELGRRGAISGLRIDHVDGLLDPEAYLRRLGRALGDPPRYVVVEKILAPGERLRPFPVDGTTGYDALAWLDGVLAYTPGAEQVTASYRELVGEARPVESIVRDAKLTVLEGSLAPEVEQLTDRLLPLVEAGDRETVRRALLELVAAFDVYRSYVRPDATVVDGEDRRRIEDALRRAKEHTSPAVLDAIGRVLLLSVSADELPACRAVLLRFQQLTGPAAAKGVEDTTFYRWFPLLALCEVGAHPGTVGTTLRGFHNAMAERQASWPLSLTSTSTHDTKRSEDARTRLLALSEIPERWASAVSTFRELAREHKTLVNGTLAPDANDEYLLYQLLLAAWPMAGAPDVTFFERVGGALIKSAREAKRHTAWVDGNAEYESALTHMLRSLLESPRFLDAFAELFASVRQAGMLSSLSLLTLKLAIPGVPDFYQGTELWALDLVDPDNRRPVDFELRRRLLSELRSQPPAPEELLSSAEDGRIKLLLTWRGLSLRRRRSGLFRDGRYVPALARGPAHDRIVSFARVLGDEAVIAVASRHHLRSTPAASPWEKSNLIPPRALPVGTYRDVFTWTEHTIDGNPLPLAQLLARLPVALLERLS